MEERRNIRKISLGKIISIKVSEKRFHQLKSGRHFEFNRVRIPVAKQLKLKIGDTIYANGEGGKSKALEFLSLEQKSGYDEDLVDVLVRVI